MYCRVRRRTVLLLPVLPSGSVLFLHGILAYYVHSAGGILRAICVIYDLFFLCFLVRAIVAHQGHEIGCLASGFVLVLVRSFSLFFVYASVVFLGLAIWGIASGFVLVLCLTSHYPQMSDVVGPGLMRMTCGPGNNGSFRFIMFARFSVSMS